ncbi:hypothetical protein Vadar_026912 [Vaccinium darrowii]|uniref:Uncharacterized protein n=1 Tax=Vaccinium darrowii TaxID=229202 RepID=A0ACB7XD32_9ERIC|nr:hypothetical protein Vadar_026912 [Vaccinium darrowii]
MIDTVEVNPDNENVVTLPGIAIVWGLVVMALVYSIGHISGGHFNPAVTIAFASCQKFPGKMVPVYISAPVIGSTLASKTLRFLFDGKHDHFPGTAPGGSNIQSLVMEFIITLFLLFVVLGVGTDNCEVKELAGLVVGAIVSVNILLARPESCSTPYKHYFYSAQMTPCRMSRADQMPSSQKDKVVIMDSHGIRREYLQHPSAGI